MPCALPSRTVHVKDSFPLVRFFFKTLPSIQEKKNLPILTKLYDVHCMLRAPAYFPPEAFKSAQASNSSRGSLRLCWCMSDWMLGWLTCCPISSSRVQTESRGFYRHLVTADRKHSLHSTFLENKNLLVWIWYCTEDDQKKSPNLDLLLHILADTAKASMFFCIGWIVKCVCESVKWCIYLPWRCCWPQEVNSGKIVCLLIKLFPEDYFQAMQQPAKALFIWLWAVLYNNSMGRLGRDFECWALVIKWSATIDHSAPGRHIKVVRSARCKLSKLKVTRSVFHGE